MLCNLHFIYEHISDANIFKVPIPMDWEGKILEVRESYNP